MIEMKSLNGFEIVDAKAREDIETLKSKEVDVDLSDYYTKEETDNKITEVVEAIPDVDLSNYYTKGEVDTALTEVESPPEVHIGTTEPTDENIKVWINPDEPSTPIPGGGGKQEVFTLDFSSATSSEQACTDEMISFINSYFENDGNVALYVKTAESSMIYPATKYKAPYGDNGEYNIYIEPYTLVQHHIENDNEPNYYIYCLASRTDGWKYSYTSTGKANVATKTYVDNAIANIPGGGSSEGGAKVYLFDAINPSSDANKNICKEIVEYWVANGTLPDVVMYAAYKYNNNHEHNIVTELNISNVGWGYTLTGVFKEGGSSYQLYCSLDTTTLNVTGCYINDDPNSSGSKDWQWISVENNNCYIGSYKHIKLVVREDGYDDRYTFDISEPDMICSVSKTYILPSYSDNITLYNNYGECSISGDRSYTIVGYYYWG